MKLYIYNKHNGNRYTDQVKLMYKGYNKERIFISNMLLEDCLLVKSAFRNDTVTILESKTYRYYIQF